MSRRLHDSTPRGPPVTTADRAPVMSNNAYRSGEGEALGPDGAELGMRRAPSRAGGSKVLQNVAGSVTDCVL